MAGNWWSWLTGTEYGSSSWSVDYEAAVDQAHGWAATVGKARGWDSAQLGKSYDLIEAAAESGDGDVSAFWVNLASRWRTADYSDEGWAGLGDTFEQAGRTVETVEAGREEATVEWDEVAEVLEEGLDDVEEEVADWTWLVVLLLVVAVVVYFGVKAYK